MNTYLVVAVLVWPLSLLVVARRVRQAPRGDYALGGLWSGFWFATATALVWPVGLPMLAWAAHLTRAERVERDLTAGRLR